MARGRPKGATSAPSPAILDRRMKVLALRREGRTFAGVAAALEVTGSMVNYDVKWLRAQGYDLGEGHTGRVLPALGAEIAQLRPTAAVADADAEVRREVSDRRIRGEDILMISIAMQISAQDVRRHLHDAARIAQEDDIEARRELQLARLDRLLACLDEGIREGSPKSINAAVRVIAEGNRLQGLYRPIQVEHTVITVDMIDQEMRRLSAELAKVEGSHEITAYLDVEGEPVDD